MPLFRRNEPSPRHVRTINGRPQPSPEGTGFPRRSRMFVECQRRLADHPLTQPGASGHLLGDGQGLEELVARLPAIFEREPSLLRWVVLRGAFTELYLRVLDRECAVTTPVALERAMGLAWTEGSESHLDLALPYRTAMTHDAHEAAVGVAASVLLRVERYPWYSELSVPEVLRWPEAHMPPAVALDAIAWCAAALLRLGIAQQIIEQVPEPDAIDEPGWYPEPLFAKACRYWDGADWTDRCRTADGQIVSVPL